jgi:hypothetical protein
MTACPYRTKLTNSPETNLCCNSDDEHRLIFWGGDYVEGNFIGLVVEMSYSPSILANWWADICSFI